MALDLCNRHIYACCSAMVAVRGRPAGLPTLELGFAHLRTAATHHVQMMLADHLMLRKNIMNELNTATPILLINPSATPRDLIEFADRRFQTIRNLMGSLSCMNTSFAEGKDLSAVADVAYQLLHEGCEALAVAQNT
ncbi:hypothetical protein [Pseudomonas abieticivorans]|uniref:hypothetical protein n=1 Tax=Pseudomonas abieticivorans TaxID=2931382 RepID=UPI0020C0A7A1|nr:hypothetical protein [Pseudomonas sp. PIA16]